jgi:transcriptional regulator with XRE-family HTH domain
MNKLGNRLKFLREKKGMTQIKVAERLNLHNKTLSDYERGVSEPDIDTLKRIAELYDVPVDYLLGSKIMDDDFQFALYGEVKDLSEEQKQDLLDMVKILKRGNKK